jgi:hypothetical protein
VKPSVAQLENLLALKRHERPGEEYWQGFLSEFHQRQQEEVELGTGPMTVFGQLSAWFAEWGPTKWACAAGLAYTTVTVAWILIPKGQPPEPAPVPPVNYKVVPTPVPKVEHPVPVDLSSSTQGRAG